MTSSENSAAPSAPLITPDTLPPAFTREVKKARAAILWERAWPRIVPPATVTALFLSASFAGVWGMASPVGRMAGVLGFAFALAASPFRYKTGSLIVTPKDALKRLDKNLGESDVEPAQEIASRIAADSSEAQKAIWNLHISNLWQKYADRFDAGKPRPGMAKLDPYHLRFLVALTLAVTTAMSQGPHIEQVKKAFDWTSPVPSNPQEAPKPALQLKAWVTPPEGINKPPLQMTEATRDHTQGGEKMIAHQTSVMTIITYGKPTEITVNGKTVPLQKELPQGQGVTGYQYEFKLEAADTIVKINHGPSWRIAVDQDKAPVVTISDIKPAEGKNNKSLDIDYNAKDDFGYTGEIVIETPDKPDTKAKPLPSAAPPVLTLP